MLLVLFRSPLARLMRALDLVQLLLQVLRRLRLVLVATRFYLVALAQLEADSNCALAVAQALVARFASRVAVLPVRTALRATRRFPVATQRAALVAPCSLLAVTVKLLLVARCRC